MPARPHTPTNSYNLASSHTHQIRVEGTSIIYMWQPSLRMGAELAQELTTSHGLRRVKDHPRNAPLYMCASERD